MGINEFQILHSDVIKCYQLVENDLKLIYAFIMDKDLEQTLNEVENITLGTIINKLEEYDKSTEPQIISDNDYNFLKQIKDNRNFWAHENYLEFIYEESPLESEAYKKQCKRLAKDHKRMENVYRNVEALRNKCREIWVKHHS